MERLGQLPVRIMKLMIRRQLLERLWSLLQQTSMKRL